MGKDALYRLAMLLLAWIIPMGVGAEPPPSPRLATLIEQLGHASYPRRQRAERTLEQLGAVARPSLETAAAQGEPEVAHRAARLLEQLVVREIWAAGPLELPEAGDDLGQLLARLSSASHTRLELDSWEPPAFPRHVLPEGGFWQVAEHLASQLGGRWEPAHRWDDRGFVLCRGRRWDATAIEGPLRLRIRQVAAGSSESAPGGTLDLNLCWEDRFRLVAYRAGPRINWRSADPTYVAEPPERGWRLPSAGKRQLTARVAVPATARTGRQPLSLEVQWELMAVGDLRQFELELCRPHSCRFRDLQVRVARPRGLGPGAHGVEVWLGTHRALPEPRDVLLSENRLQVLSADGCPLRVLDHQARIVEDGVRIVLRVATPDGRRPARLRIEHPGVRTQRVVRFEFQEVSREREDDGRIRPPLTP